MFTDPLISWAADSSQFVVEWTTTSSSAKASHGNPGVGVAAALLIGSHATHLILHLLSFSSHFNYMTFPAHVIRRKLQDCCEIPHFLSWLHLLHLLNGQKSKVTSWLCAADGRSATSFLLFSLPQQHPAAHPTPVLSFVERQPEGTILEGAE